MQFQEEIFDSFDFTSFFACTADAASDDRVMCDLNMVLKDLIGNMEILIIIIGKMLIFHGRIILAVFILCRHVNGCRVFDLYCGAEAVCVLTLSSKAHLERWYY